MPRHREKVREIPGLDGTPTSRYPGRSQYRPEIDLKCVMCGRVIKYAGWWMGGEMVALVRNQSVSLVCDGEGPELEHRYEVEGRWLWKQINDASNNGYSQITIAHRFLVT